MFPIIDKIIDIGRRLPQIIGNLKELLAKLINIKNDRRIIEKLSRFFCFGDGSAIFWHQKTGTLGKICDFPGQGNGVSSCVY